jgi:hypothetical protein
MSMTDGGMRELLAGAIRDAQTGYGDLYGIVDAVMPIVQAAMEAAAQHFPVAERQGWRCRCGIECTSIEAWKQHIRALAPDIAAKTNHNDPKSKAAPKPEGKE